MDPRDCTSAALLAAGGAVVGGLVASWLWRAKDAPAAREEGHEFLPAAAKLDCNLARVDTEDATVRVVCFGDSNTWGYDAFSPNADVNCTRRYGEARRWPRILAKHLGDGFAVIEEGLNGRTTMVDDPFMTDYDANGRRALPAILHSHKPVDVVVLMLGTNDLKAHLGLSPTQITKGAGTLASDVLSGGLGRTPAGPRVLVVAPAIVWDHEAWAFVGAREKAKKCAAAFAAEAAARGVSFLDANLVCAIPDPKVRNGAPTFGDGIHLSPRNCEALGDAIAAKITDMLANPL